MALSLGGERSFKALTASRWKSFANRARLSEPAVLKAVAETVALVDGHWWDLPARNAVSKVVRDRIDEHIKAMIPVLKTCAEK